MRRKVFPLTEISLDDRRDLGDRDNFYPIWTQLSRLAGKLSVYTLQNLHHRGKLYPVSGKTFLHMNRTTLFDLSKCFLGNRDNLCPYEQALRLVIFMSMLARLTVYLDSQNLIPESSRNFQMVTTSWKKWLPGPRPRRCAPAWLPGSSWKNAWCNLMPISCVSWRSSPTRSLLRKYSEKSRLMVCHLQKLLMY